MVQAQVLELLTYLSNELGLALVFVTHDLPIVAQTCTRAAVMYAGRIVEQGPTEALYHETRHPYTRMLWAATPDLDAREDVLSIPGVPPRLDAELHGCPFAPRCYLAASRCTSERPELLAVGDGHVSCLSLRELGRGRARDGAREPTVVARSSRSTISSSATASPAASAERSCVGRSCTCTPCPASRYRSGVARWSRSSASPVAARPRPRRRSCAWSSADSGRVPFDGVDVTASLRRDLRALRRRMQIIYQDPYESLDPRFRVATTVAEPLVIHRIGSRCERARGRHRVRSSRWASRLRSSSRTGPRTSSPAASASGSRSPRASSSGRSSSSRTSPCRCSTSRCAPGSSRILDELRDQGLAVLMITHDLSTAARFADRICVMYLGRIVEEGPARGSSRARGTRTRRRCSPSFREGIRGIAPSRRSCAARRRTRSRFRSAAVSIHAARSRSMLAGRPTRSSRSRRRARPPGGVHPRIAAPTGGGVGSCARSAARRGRCRSARPPRRRPRRRGGTSRPWTGASDALRSSRWSRATRCRISRARSPRPVRDCLRRRRRGRRSAPRPSHRTVRRTSIRSR